MATEHDKVKGQQEVVGFFMFHGDGHESPDSEAEAGGLLQNSETQH